MPSASMLEAGTSMCPVPLVCPHCDESLRAEPCSCPSAARLGHFHHIPRTYFGPDREETISEDRWRQLLDLTEHKPWPEALPDIVGAEETDHQLHHLGADLLFGLPWQRIPTVLEVGARFGSMTTLLATLAPQVVAVDWIPERALFLARRLRQTGLGNVAPLIANPQELPFAPESFDMIALDGQFAEMALFGSGDSFLAQALRLLRPGGLLYLGTETSGFPGKRGLPCTPGRYEAMLRRAGFAALETFGVVGSFRHQKAAYPMTSKVVRQAMQDIVAPPGSAAGALRRFLLDHVLPASLRQRQLVFVAGKPPVSHPLLWSSLRTTAPVGQFNTSTKVSMLAFEKGGPSRLTRVSKSNSDARLLREYCFLEQAEKVLADETSSLRLRCPRVAGKDPGQVRNLFHFEYVPGRSLAQCLLPRVYRPKRFRVLVTDLVEGYVELVRHLTSGWPTTTSEEPFLDSLARVDMGDPGLQRHLQHACITARSRAWPAQVMHGDLTLNNAIVDAHGRLVLVDWENACTNGLAGIDLMRLLFDAWLEQKLYAPWLGPGFLKMMRNTVGQGLARLGFRPDDMPDLEVLFLAHQIQFDCCRGNNLDNLLRAHRERALELNFACNETVSP